MAKQKINAKRMDVVGTTRKEERTMDFCSKAFEFTLGG